MLDQRLHLYILYCHPSKRRDSMQDQYRPTVYDVGPTLVQHWIDVSCLLPREQTSLILATGAISSRLSDTNSGIYLFLAKVIALFCW